VLILIFGRVQSVPGFFMCLTE